MEAFKENPIITLACRNYCVQYGTNTTKANSWTAVSPTNEDDIDISDLRSVTWSSDVATFIASVFPTGTVFETCVLTFDNGHKAVCLCLDGSGVYTSGNNKVYYLVEIANGGLLKTHQISKAGDVWDHKYLPNLDSSEELLNCLTAVKYDKTTEGGSITPEALHAVLSASLGINADLNAAGTKVDVHPDMTLASDGYVWTARTVTPTEGEPYLTAEFDTIENALQATQSDVGKYLKLGNAGIMWGTPHELPATPTAPASTKTYTLKGTWTITAGSDPVWTLAWVED